LLARQDLSVSDFYLPTALAVVLIHWLGPKYVLPMVYTNAVCTSLLWGIPIESWPLWFLFAIPETLFAFLSWFLFRITFHGKFWLPDTHNTSLFLAIGVFLPAIIETFLLQSMLMWSGNQSVNTFWEYVGSNLMSEFTTSLCLTLPALYYITPFVQKTGYAQEVITKNTPLRLPAKREIIELIIIFLSLLALVFLIEFVKYWYIYGFFSLFVAIRYGFGPAILSNLYILLITYILPKLINTFGKNDVGDYIDVSNILLGANFLFVFATITGRVISDLKHAELKLMKQNEALTQTNQELDRFVYSVSHDLSAPLKSILGLVNISRITTDPQEQAQYQDRIERSVRKLETFISEILDYSRNKRQDIVVEKIQLKGLCQQILDDLQYVSPVHTMNIVYELYEPEIWQDKSRLKIILNNLLSNAIKFQKTYPGHEPYIKISSKKTAGIFLLQVEDNGEGIKVDQQDKIGNMFYRGHEKSTGSGLGLYIVKEVVVKLKGNFIVKSEYGKGSLFEVQLKDLKPD
jgi:signal transduction histidine kinase